MPRAQAVIMPVLRERLPGITFVSWEPDVDYRTYPFVKIRRLGGVGPDPQRLDRPVVEITAFSRDGLVATEDIYLDVRQVIWEMVQNQTVVPNIGYLHSFTETLGPIQLDADFDDAWRIQGLIQIGVRPPRP
jgi:hypothetical protein